MAPSNPHQSSNFRVVFGHQFIISQTLSSSFVSVITESLGELVTIVQIVPASSPVEGPVLRGSLGALVTGTTSKKVVLAVSADHTHHPSTYDALNKRCFGSTYLESKRNRFIDSYWWGGVLLLVGACTCGGCTATGRGVYCYCGGVYCYWLGCVLLLVGVCTATGGGVYCYWWGRVLLLVGACTATGGGVYCYWWGCVLLLVGACTGGGCTATGEGVYCYWWGCVLLLVGVCTATGGGVYCYW